ncbi:MAG: L,D-transpeptidase family protein [Verrucomicrobiales bacterium]
MNRRLPSPRSALRVLLSAGLVFSAAQTLRSQDAPSEAAEDRPASSAPPVDGAGTDGDASRESVPDEELIKAEAIREQVLGLLPEDRHYRTLAADVIAKVYRERGFRPLWDSSDLPPDFHRALGRELVAHGFPELLILDPAALESAITDTTLEKRDLAHTVSFCDAALLVRLGIAPTEAIWEEWNKGDTPGSNDRSVEALSGKLVVAASASPFDLSKAVAVMAPKNWIYRELLKAYPEAKESILSYSGLPSIPDPSSAGVGRPSEAYPYAPAVAEHLADRGYLEMAPEGISELSTMTPELTAALTAFQKDHGLEVDGIFGPSSWRYLNTNAADRYRSITINLHRARLLPDGLGERYIIANLPSAELHAFDANDFHVMSMRIVHGKASDSSLHTKIFRDTMQEIVFGPYWNVPRSIAMKEIIPKAQGDWGYLSRNGYEIVDAFNPGSTRTYRLSPDSLDLVSQGKLLVRQRPGPSNALGSIKFLFPNTYSIYMHDTPAKNLFARSERDFSHGCVRVEKPDELGAWVLGTQGWSAEEVKETMTSGRRKNLAVKDKINVYLTYFTTFPRPGPGGKIILAPARDVYERDPIDARTLAAILPWKEEASAPVTARPITGPLDDQ